jgi:hypothetical protein
MYGMNVTWSSVRRVIADSRESGATMVRQGDPRASSSTRDNSRQTSDALDLLDEAVTELRRLTQGEVFQALERLADVEEIRGASSLSVENVRNEPCGCVRVLYFDYSCWRGYLGWCQMWSALCLPLPCLVMPPFASRPAGPRCRQPQGAAHG